MKRKLNFLLKSRNASIIFEDDSIIVIDKPANLLVIPDRYNQSIPNLYHILKGELGEIFVVHRIDKETSGVIVFAKNAMAHSNLNDQFENRQVEKTYCAIVNGTPAELQGKINTPITESQNHPGIMKVDLKRGKPSLTDYKVVESFNGYAFVAAAPKTGRMHQIRIHLASIGTPIMCDRIYGDGKPFFLSHIKTKYFSEGDEKPLLSRAALHAESISFYYSAKNERVTFAAEIPKDMRSVLNYLRKFRAMASSPDVIQLQTLKKSASANV